MRISDWSSDVCSSDLYLVVMSAILPPRAADWPYGVQQLVEKLASIDALKGDPRLVELQRRIADRKSVVSGKREAVRVDLGGRRILKKKKKAYKTKTDRVIVHHKLINHNGEPTK